MPSNSWPRVAEQEIESGPWVSMPVFSTRHKCFLEFSLRKNHLENMLKMQVLSPGPRD